MINYFAYGSNMNPARMQERGMEIFSMHIGRLHNFKLKFNKQALTNNTGYANIEIAKKSFVEGVLYRVNKRDIKKLDFFEGFPFHYKRYLVNIELYPNYFIKAIVYIAVQSWIRQGLKPSKEYLQHLLKAKKYLTRDYYHYIRRIACA